jgi:endoglucanase
MGFGTNIANTFENTATWETGWGMPLVTSEYVNGMAANGIKTVRVPVAWETFSENGVIPADKMARVREVVQWIVDADMYAIVNIHWDGGWIRNEGTPNEYTLTDDVRQKFDSYWQQIAAEFTDIGYRLVFEGMNEEGEFYVNGDKDADVPDYAPLNELNQLFVDTVRSRGGYNETRNLLIAGFTTSIDRTCVDAFAIPTDPAGAGRLFLSIHYYEPFTFTLMVEPADWGGWVYPRTTWGTAEDLATRDQLFATMSAFSSERGVPTIIGEFTAIPGEGEYVRETASRVAWLRSVIETCLSHGMVPLLFDANYDVLRSDGSFSADLTAAVAGLGL